MMSALVTTVIVLFLSHESLAIENATGKTIINVDVYYEALCGDSVRFIKYQLVPSYPNLQDHLQINFIPYGKATHRRDEETGRWSFMCQHGSAECKGNRAQACALETIEKNEKVEDRQRLSVNLIGCVMSSTNPSTAVPRCGQSVDLSAITRQRIADCEESTLADDLLAGYGNKTHSLDPALSFVPTVIINGVYSSENQNTSLTDFQKLICDLIPQDERPVACSSS